MVEARALSGLLCGNHMDVVVDEDGERLVGSDRYVVTSHEVMRKEA